MVTAVLRGKIEQLDVGKIIIEFILRNDQRRHSLFHTEEAAKCVTKY